MSIWHDEVVQDTMRLGLKVTEVLYSDKSDFQDILIVQTEGYGNALMLDGCWMTAEKEEKTYHEMITHPALTTAQTIKRVLIIGGADGGVAREVLSYPEVEWVDLVEIDGVLVEACKKHLSKIGTAWNDPRLHVHICDGIDYVLKYTDEPYDVILVDGCDPVGPAEVLYNDNFYTNCCRILSETGVFVTQAEDPHVFREDHLKIIKNVQQTFEHVFPYYAGVMLYPGNTWSWIYATNATFDHLNPYLTRIDSIEWRTEWYNREIHTGAFAVPNAIKLALKP